MGNISKHKVAFAILVFLCAGVLCIAQDSGGQGVPNSSIQNQTIASPVINESDLLIGNAAASDATAQRSNGLSTVFLLLRMIVVLAIVIACIYLVIWFLRRSTRVSNNADPFLRVVSNITLSQGKSIHVVTLLEHAYIVGVTDNAVNLIGEVTDKELVDAMNTYADKQDQTTKPRNFNDVLSIFMPNGPRNRNQNVYGNSADTAEQFLKMQRDRLRDGE